jgi:hypothetical protein
MTNQQQQPQQQQQHHGDVEGAGVLPVETDKLLLAAKHKIPSNENDDSTTMFQDAVDILVLSGPIFLAMISWLGMKTTDTALLGHVSADALAAAALSDLWTMCTAVLIQGRVLGILVGGAMGAGNPKLGGIYLQVSLVVLSGVSVIVFIAWNCTEQVWVAFGSNADIAADAGYYARILSLSIPGMRIEYIHTYIHTYIHYSILYLFDGMTDELLLISHLMLLAFHTIVRSSSTLWSSVAILFRTTNHESRSSFLSFCTWLEFAVWLHVCLGGWNS